MKLSDLTPGRTWEDPEIPPATGPDAAIFAAYARMVRYYELVGPLTAAETKARRKELSKALRVHETARVRFIETPARTIEGVLLKIRYVLAGEGIPEDGHIYDAPALLQSAIEDIEAMIAKATQPTQRAGCRKPKLAA